MSCAVLARSPFDLQVGINSRRLADFKNLLKFESPQSDYCVRECGRRRPNSWDWAARIRPRPFRRRC